MRINKDTGAPTRYRVVKEETGLSKKGAARRIFRPPKNPLSVIPPPSSSARPKVSHSRTVRPINPSLPSQARCPNPSKRSAVQHNGIRDADNNVTLDESLPLDEFQEAHYNAYREEYKRRPGDTLVLHPHRADASQDPYVYKPEETTADKVLAELDKFDLYDTIEAIAAVVSSNQTKEEPESPASKAAGSWRNSLEHRPPILTSHRDNYSYRSRGQQALSPKSTQPALSLHRLEGNIAETSEDHMEDPGPVPTYGFYPPAKKKNIVYLQSGVKQRKKTQRVTKGDASIGCVDTGVCNNMCADFPGLVDLSDANSLDGEELGELENQHARQVKVDKTWIEALQSTIKAAAASKDDRVSAVDTLRTEFNEGTNDLSGFRRTTLKANGDDDIDKGVRFGRDDQFAGSTPPSAPNPLWHLFK